MGEVSEKKTKPVEPRFLSIIIKSVSALRRDKSHTSYFGNDF